MAKLKGPWVLILVQAVKIDRKAAQAAGLSYYFAPKPCGKCGTSVRLIGGTCRACKAVQSREWLVAHEDGQEYMRLASRKYQEANRETCRKRSKAWKKRTGWTEDPAYRAAHTEKNRERIEARRRNYYHENKPAFYAKAHEQRAKRRGAEGRFTAKDTNRILKSQDGMCAYCYESDNLHLDHKVPISRGGTNWPDNLQYLCAFHNLSKHARTDSDYRAILISGGFNVRTPE